MNLQESHSGESNETVHIEPQTNHVIRSIDYDGNRTIRCIAGTSGLHLRPFMSLLDKLRYLQDRKPGKITICYRDNKMVLTDTKVYIYRDGGHMSFDRGKIGGLTLSYYFPEIGKNNISYFIECQPEQVEDIVEMFIRFESIGQSLESKILMSSPSMAE